MCHRVPRRNDICESQINVLIPEKQSNAELFKTVCIFKFKETSSVKKKKNLKETSTYTYIGKVEK